MKIIKNTCFGGYSLSAKAKIEVAKRKGLEIFFFDGDEKQLTHEEVLGSKYSMFYMDYTVPNPYELGVSRPDEDGFYTTANELAKKLSIDFDNRTDTDIISVVETLGKEANGSCAKLEVVEIPDGIEYEIDEYDGNETIRETHCTW